METKELLYGDKPMNPTPINIGMTALAARLRAGETMVAQLEPGDATYYCLLIVPAWAEGVRDNLQKFGIRPERAYDYMIVTQLDDHGGATFYALVDGAEPLDMVRIKNDWTRQVFATLDCLGLLWDEKCPPMKVRL